MFIYLPLRLHNPVKFSNAPLTRDSAYNKCTNFHLYTIFVLFLVILQLKHSMLFHTARAMCVAWSPDSSKIVSGGIDTNICVWDAKKGEKITMIKGT